MSFIHLHVYSAYSLLSSTATVEQLVSNAKQRGFSAIALTDRNVMYGAISFYKECLKQSIKPIIGLTVDVISHANEEESYPLVLLAKNQEGFQNLLKITSVVQTKSPQGIPLKWLKHYAKGLVAITTGLRGEIETHLLNEDVDTARQTAILFSKLFGEDFYLALQNHDLPVERELKGKLLQLAKEENLKVAATNEVQYIDQVDAPAHECLLAIKNGDKLQDEHRERLSSDQYYLKDPNEVRETFADFPDALENTIKIAEQCNVMIQLDQRNLPKYPTDNGITADELLEKLCWEGFKERYDQPSEEHEERLRYELNVIKKMNFSDYFLIVWDFMKFSRDNGILTGPGRGSAAGSMVAFVLHITDVDPIEHHLLFERFLNPERISMPDIDIDFPDHRRDEVIDYVGQKYGELHVAQIVTFGTLAAKAVLRDVGRAFGLNTKELDMLSRLIPARLGIDLKHAYQESDGLKAFVKESPQNQKLFEIAKKLEGLPRHTSTHAAGVVISEEPLVNVIPIQQGQDQVYLTQYSMEHLEDVGLLKMDFLGLRNLTLIESILAAIQRRTGKKIDIKTIPLDDGVTFELLSRGETSGIFQLESEGMRNVLKRLQPTRFEDIVAVNALYRPGPMENIPLFIDRRHGREEVSYPHPDLKDILENTYGVIVYQEQIMQIASRLAGFSLGEADLLRRAVSKKQKATLDKERAHFVKGAQQKGYDEKVANDIYDLIVRFANYGFNRSHAVAYSFIAYQLAYLKANYPLYFMAALLSSVIGNEGKISQYIRELREMNINILPPSINQSGYSFIVEKNAIRYSLSALKGVGFSALKDIFSARKSKKFQDLFDLCIRVRSKAINRKVLEGLVHSGSFDEFGEDRATLLASLDVAIEHAQLVRPDDDDDQVDLFSDDDFFIKPKYVEVDPIRPEDKLLLEKEVLGLYLSDHPVSIYEKYFKALNSVQLTDIATNNQQGSVVYITETKSIRTKKGESMAFLTVSDQSGDIEAVVFPTVYKRLSAVLKKGSIIFLEGKAEERDGKRQLIVQNGKAINEAIEGVTIPGPTLFIKIEHDQENQEQLSSIKKILNKSKGNSDVILYYDRTKKSVRLGVENRINPSAECLEQLRQLLGDKNVILKG